MTDELTFHAGRAKWAFRLIFCIVFVAIVNLILPGTVFGWASIIFLGLITPVYLVGIFSPGSTYLRLDSEGFEIRPLLGRKSRTKWTDVQGVELGSIGRLKVIRISRLPSTSRGVIIQDNYRASLTEILKILEQWRRRHGQASRDVAHKGDQGPSITNTKPSHRPAGPETGNNRE